ncbi:MAG: hypothetical protein RI988_3623 [Pseudomonadota bacterium]
MGRDRLSRLLGVLWPAFVTAGVLEALVFVVVDPATLQAFGSKPLAWSPKAVYSITFFVFWGVIAVGCAITALVNSPEPDG